MTLPDGASETGAARRAIELICAVEELDRDLVADDRASEIGTRAASVTDRDPRSIAITEVFDRWEDRPDARLEHELDSVLDVIAELASLVDITDPDRAARAVNDLLERWAGPPRLVHEPGWGWHVHVDRVGAGWADWLAASSAMGFAALLARRDRLPWGRCAAEDCRRPFIDQGRRTPQRFCSDTCATRERVRRHRTRR